MIEEKLTDHERINQLEDELSKLKFSFDMAIEFVPKLQEKLKEANDKQEIIKAMIEKVMHLLEK